jgi:putative protease
MEVEIGRVTHYYNHLHVAVLKLAEPLEVGDLIHVLGHSTDFMQKVTSLQIDYHNVVGVHPGDEVALKVIEPVREHDVIYRVPKEEFEPGPVV